MSSKFRWKHPIVLRLKMYNSGKGGEDDVYYAYYTAMEKQRVTITLLYPASEVSGLHWYGASYEGKVLHT